MGAHVWTLLLPLPFTQVDDSEQLGGNILGTLHDQRGQLEDAIERNQDIETDLQRSNRLIRRMFQRAFTIKVGLSCFALMLFCAICVVVYLKWLAPAITSHASPPPPPPPPAGGRQLQQEEDPELGDGLIALIAIGTVFFLAMVAASASTPARKFGTICGLGCVYMIIVLFLVLLPRKDYNAAARAPPSPPPPPAPPHILLPSAPPLTVPWPAPSLPSSRPCRSQEAVDEPESDVAGLLRILLGCVLGLCALIGPVLVLVTHVLAQQKAPVVNDGSEELAPSAI